MTASGPDGPKSTLTVRLETMTAELQELEQAITSGNLDSRVLSEFRKAVDYIRNTTWTVQQWVDAREKSEDPYSVLPALAAQRVHRATQLANDLCLDLQSVEVTAETEGIGDLHRAVGDLHTRLDLLFNRGS